MILKVCFGKKTHLINIQDKLTIQALKKSITQIFKSLPNRYTLSYLDEDGDEITLHDQQDYQILLTSNSKTTKVNIKEVNEEFMELTEKIEIEEQISEIRQKVEEMQLQEPKEPVKVVNEPFIPQIDQSMIEERLKKMLPQIISKVKSEISEQLSQRSRIHSQPLITEDHLEQEKPSNPFSRKMEEPLIQEERQNTVVHKGVTCDNCHKKDITGARYKCSVCSNFDFCQECQATFEHPHSFLKIKNPKQAPLKIFTVVNDEENNIQINGQRINAPPGFEGLVHHGLNFFENMLHRRGQHRGRGQRRNSEGGCPFRRNCRRNNEEAETKPEPTKVQKAEPHLSEIFSPKVEQKPEPKLENEDKIVENARYLASLGFQFSKCYQWAKTYWHLSKEDLLQFCLNQPGFLNTK